MSGLPYMNWYIADHFGDTRHLSLEEQGAYLILLGTMWLADGYLPNDPKTLARIVGVNPRKWRAIAPQVMPFFTEVDGGKIMQKRLLKEWEKATNTNAKRREASKRAIEVRAQNLHQKVTGLEAEKKAKPLKSQKQASPNGSSYQNQSQRLSSIEERCTRAGARPTPLTELMKALDKEHADAVIEHRRVKGSPLTARAAMLLANKFAKCPDPNGAADVMIEAGWQGFEQEWVENRKASRARAGPNGSDGLTAWQRQERAIDEVFDELNEGDFPSLPFTDTD